MAYKDKAWKDLDTARGFSHYFHNGKIYKTSAGYVVIGASEKKKFKSWKFVERGRK